jgi:3-dehydroquinate dehydratase-2
MKILILNGPNLNMLGLREPKIYGTQTLDEIKALCFEVCQKHDLSCDFKQSNHEGELVELIQSARGTYDAILINGAAYTHTSIAIHDALKLLECPIFEIHLSDPKSREEFRHHSYIEPLAVDVFSGHGDQSYVLAIEKCAQVLKA